MENRPGIPWALSKRQCWSFWVEPVSGPGQGPHAFCVASGVSASAPKLHGWPKLVLFTPPCRRAVSLRQWGVGQPMPHNKHSPSGHLASVRSGHLSPPAALSCAHPRSGTQRTTPPPAPGQTDLEGSRPGFQRCLQLRLRAGAGSPRAEPPKPWAGRFPGAHEWAPRVSGQPGAWLPCCWGRLLTVRRGSGWPAGRAEP